MNSTHDQKFVVICTGLLTAVACTFALAYTKSVVIPFVFAIFYYAASLPLMRFLESRLQMPRLLSLLTTLGLVLGISTLGLIQLTIFLGTFWKGIEHYRQIFIQLIEQAALVANQYGITVEEDFFKSFLTSLPLAGYMKTLTGNTIYFFANALLIFILYCFLMMGRHSSDTTQRREILVEMERKISSYVLNKIFLSLLTGVLIGLILSAYGIRFAWVFATLCFILNFIPSIGSLIATALPLPVVVVQYGLGSEFVMVLAMSSACQILIGNVIDPKIIGKDLDLHPITIILSLVFWGLIWGTAGMFLATPVTAILKLGLSRLKPTYTLSEFMAGRL
ncbi:MAG: AI-2E family transporter [Zetaproteobacteria bacterium]|nr:AI-2E family transporter [Zetaproteobacteria bacterium]